jgi:hypothetical protein
MWFRSSSGGSPSVARASCGLAPSRHRQRFAAAPKYGVLALRQLGHPPGQLNTRQDLGGSAPGQVGAAVADSPGNAPGPRRPLPDPGGRGPAG